MIRTLTSVILILSLSAACKGPRQERSEISLNGTWDIASTESSANIPTDFHSAVRVPGLVDMAVPAVNVHDSLFEHSVFWYRRFFKADPSNHEVVRLKINKSMYHTRVYINGRFIGENVYCYTPSVFDIKPFLKEDTEKNELLISVGSRNQLPDTVVNGHDFEKTIYQPGIYDDVKLIQSNFPYIENVQIIPNTEAKQIQVTGILLIGKQTGKIRLSWKIYELSTDSLVSEGQTMADSPDHNETAAINFTATVPDGQLWSPEHPFLYKLALTAGTDTKTVRFGLRTFKFSSEKGVALLNGKPYFMRGTNVCIFRFFEDPARGRLPWDEKWVNDLHQKFRDMNWNSIRYCIGFPPERWYDTADSLGLLIQDEFPIWTGGPGGFEKWQKKITADQLSHEYAAWMKERWNHPCVVIWDAQNESVNDVTGEAIAKVRTLDDSGRPWDNGWAEPVDEGDALESHPYLFSKYNYSSDKPGRNGILSDLLSIQRIPDNGPNEHSPDPSGKNYKNAVIINEYGWLWLNRDGTPTTLTENIYRNIFPQATTADERFNVYARNIAALTEYWRAGRKSAAVMHFCGLGYSRPNAPKGQTSDNFINIQNLEFEPHFVEYVKQAFNPVGIMIRVWDNHFSAGREVRIPVNLINDRYENWEGMITLSLRKDNEVVLQSEVPAGVKGLEGKQFDMTLRMPQAAGWYILTAEITDKGKKIRSVRDFLIK